MTNVGPIVSSHGLGGHGIDDYKTAHWNLAAPALYEHTLRRGDSALAEGGALVVLTGTRTGRSPNDKFIVDEPSTHDNIWWGDVNVAIDAARFDRLHADIVSYFAERDLYVQDLQVGADADYRMDVRVVSESPWHSLFARNMFLEPPAASLASFPAAVHGPARAVPASRSRHPRHQLRLFYSRELRARHGAHRRHRLRRRDQEIDLLDPQLSPARARCAADALLGQRRYGRR